MKEMIKCLFIIAIVTGFIRGGATYAQEESQANNIYGLHLNQPEEDDIKLASQLVNSQGGNWGYVTLTIQQKERDIERWNQTMNLFRRYHLIPLVRIATESCGSNWCRPTPESVSGWIDFLANPKLIWPTRPKRVILFNEPNHASEWGGQTDPQSYADITLDLCKALKEKNDDFFVMGAGFDAAAPQRSPQFMDEAEYLRQVYAYKPEVFDCVDGWASHSYPNHGYISSPFKTGRNSVRTYEWELGQLRQLGITKNYCVYITETGWPHEEGTTPQSNYLSANQVASYYSDYFSLISQDSRVCAVTPFLINDQSELFEHFSWRKPDSKECYPQCDSLKNTPKQAGDPEQKQIFNIKAQLPTHLTALSDYSIPLNLTNGGEAWLDIEDGYRLGIIEGTLAAIFTPIVDMQPKTAKQIDFRLKTGQEIGKQCVDIGVYKQDQIIVKLFQWCFEVEAAPSLEFQVGSILKTSGEVELQVFDKDERVVFKRSVFVDKTGVIPELRNVIVGDTYRLVVVKDYHVPVQQHLVIQSGINKVTFDTLVPIDFNNDGQFTLTDLLSIRKRVLERNE